MIASNPLPMSWANLHVATCDDAGNVYVLLSQSESEWTLASLDRERRLRWKVPAPTRWAYMEDSTNIRISAWSEGGALVLWTRGRHTAHLVSCRDGSVVGKIGEAGDGRVDLTRARSVAVDEDGSLLVVAAGVLRRFATEGAPLPLWEGNPVAELALAEPSQADRAFALVGWDGATWVSTYRAKGLLWGENFENRWPRWRRYDGNGQTLAWSDAYFLLSEAGAAWADAAGHPYALWLVGGSVARLMRYAADLKSFEYWLTSSVGPPIEPGTFDPEKLRPTRRTPIEVRTEGSFAIAPDGAIWAFGSLDRLRCFDPSGEPTYVSPACRAADANRE